MYGNSSKNPSPLITISTQRGRHTGRISDIGRHHQPSEDPTSHVLRISSFILPDLAYEYISHLTTLTRISWPPPTTAIKCRVSLVLYLVAVYATMEYDIA